MKEELFLPKDYKFNKTISNEETSSAFWNAKRDNKRTFFWQVPVYKLAKLIIQQYNAKTICDLGCGTGYKTTKYLCYTDRITYGVDQKSGIMAAKPCNHKMSFVEYNIEDVLFFDWLKKAKPDLVIFSDVIEHLEFPRKFLLNLFNSLEKNTLLLVSTPNRNKLDNINHNGPPQNKRHTCEWTDKEFSLFVQSIGFNIIKRHDLFPRKYNIGVYEITRFLYRLFRFKQVPDKKSCMAFLLQKK